MSFGDWLKKNTDTNDRMAKVWKCTARSKSMYVQAYLALHCPQNKSVAQKSRIGFKPNELDPHTVHTCIYKLYTIPSSS